MAVHLPSAGALVFVATVTGTGITTVTWKATEGELAPSGLTATYTAPAAVGGYEVTVTSRADTSRSASATLTVGQVGAVACPDPRPYP